MRIVLLALLAGEGGVLVQTTLQVGLLVVALVLVKAVVGPRLPARWHAALWLLVVLRLLLPWTPASPTSAFNLARLLVPSAPLSAPASVSEGAAAGDTKWLAPALSPAARAPSLSPRLLPRTLGAVWLAGALVVAGYTLWSFWTLWRAVRARRLVTDQGVLDLLEDCKAEMRLQTVVAVVETDRVESPALFGFVRPRLLLPEGLAATLAREELRHVFLHELAHLRRWDVHLGWLSAVLLALHWFNPLIWVAFSRLRAEREMACDELALSHLDADGRRQYGRTLLRLLESWPQPPGLVAAAGLFETADNARRRIARVAAYRPDTFRWSFPTAAPLVLLALVFLTNMRPLPAWGGATTQAEARSRRVDRTDHPFVDDPAILGGWRAVDFVSSPEAFEPGARRFPGELPLEELHFLAGGRTSTAFRWTRGLLVHGTASRYEIRVLGGTPHLFMEWKSGDYVLRGAAPRSYVFESVE